MPQVSLENFAEEDRNQFILDNQEAFKYGAVEEFGLRDDHFEDEEEGEIISRKTIEECIDDPATDTYRILVGGEKMGGAIVKIDKMTGRNDLEILFVSPKCHSKGVGYEAWKLIEEKYPETKVWVTCTPYSRKGTSIFTSINAALRSWGSSISFIKAIIRICSMTTACLSSRKESISQFSVRSYRM